MTDNRQERGPQDRSRINVNEDYELSYWSKEFGVSPDELVKAVESVGVSADKVREHLKH
jgi:hypothetical protein